MNELERQLRIIKSRTEEIVPEEADLAEDLTEHDMLTEAAYG